MKLLPNELLVKIFEDLPVYSQRQCLQVCRSWSAAARIFTNDETQKVEFYDTNSISDLIQEITLNPARGLSIRQMYFLLDGDSNHVEESKLLPFLMRGCPNIAELVFANGSQFVYIDSQFDHNVNLSKLEMIRFGRYKLYPGHLKDREDLLFKNRKTLNQLCISINKRDLWNSRILYVENYLLTFTNLKCLSLATSCPILFDALIKACPQLQTLKLTLYNGAHFQVLQAGRANDRRNSLLTGFPVSQLEVLEINHDLMTADLYVYVRRCCHYLSQLVLFIDRCINTGPLIDIFDTFQDNALPLTVISINGDISGANKLAQSLYKWFPHMNQVDVGCFNSKIASGDYCKFSVDINQKHLLCLSVNISSLFDTPRPLERVVLEIITENATAWYQREGGWNADAQFDFKKNEQYTNDSAREETTSSYNTAVISIKAQSIQILYVYFRKHQNSFAQIIHLNQ